MTKELTFKKAMTYLLDKMSERDITNLVNACGADALIAEAADRISEDKYKAELENRQPTIHIAEIWYKDGTVKQLPFKREEQAKPYIIRIMQDDNIRSVSLLTLQCPTIKLISDMLYNIV